MQVYSALFFKIETSGQILDTTRSQWKQFMRKQWKWMGNVLMGDEKVKVDSYGRLSTTHLRMMIHQIYGSQQIRSQSLAVINRSDIRLNKKQQSIKLQKLMVNANLQTSNYVEFE